MKKLFSLLIVLSVTAYAVVPTTDIYQQATDDTTTAQYAGQVSTYLGQISSTMNAAEQVKGLQGLSAVQGAGTQLCNLCNKSDIASMQSYVNQVNGDLCSQFSNALTNITGAKQSISTLQGIMATFATNPKAAALALQQASIATQTASQNTIAQMQMLQTQIVQKQLAEEKLTKQQSNTMNAGFSSGW